MPFYVTDPDSPGKHIDVIELQRRNPYKTMPPVLITDWLKHDLWTRIQAIQLLAGYIPDNQLSITNPKRYLDGTSDVQLSPLIHPIRDEILSNIMTLSNWAGLSEANETKPPQEWLSWAKEKGFTPYWLDYAKANQSAPAPKVNAVHDDEKRAVNKAADNPPGKMPRTAIGKLAIKAAWEIEQETKQRATVNEVIAKLKAWVNEEEALCNIIKNGVSWQTTGLKVKDFDIDACSKALKTWHSSRT